ncbi:nucleotidyltransferase [Sinobaca sp. H24]|uniref:nucleotidyltransferase n=1 Tax=Sinobaca sp. H24 TaxID=2923376 RepID=UPI0020796C5F|nr:nucleotidyltransferase [Sinobaca sp. H24]
MTDSINFLSSRRALEKLVQYQNELENPNESIRDILLTVAGILNEQFTIHNIEAIVVGGTSVELYSDGQYTTRDLDIFSDEEAKIVEIMKALGFEKVDRHFVHSSLAIYVEFPSGEFKGDKNHVIEVFYNGYTIKMIGMEDIIIDRLTNAVNTGAPADLEWARKMMTAQFDKVNWRFFTKEQLSKKQYGLTKDHIERILYFIEETNITIQEFKEGNTSNNLQKSLLDLQVLRGDISVKEAKKHREEI